MLDVSVISEFIKKRIWIKLWEVLHGVKPFLLIFKLKSMMVGFQSVSAGSITWGRSSHSYVVNGLTDMYGSPLLTLRGMMYPSSVSMRCLPPTLVDLSCTICLCASIWAHE